MLRREFRQPDLLLRRIARSCVLTSVKQRASLQHQQRDCWSHGGTCSHSIAPSRIHGISDTFEEWRLRTDPLIHSRPHQLQRSPRVKVNGAILVWGERGIYRTAVVVSVLTLILPQLVPMPPPSSTPNSITVIIYYNPLVSDYPPLTDSELSRPRCC